MNAIDKIIENMPKNLEVNTQIRYIYLELGKIFKKDIAFFYGTDEEKQKIYDMEADMNFSENYLLYVNQVQKYINMLSLS